MHLMYLVCGKKLEYPEETCAWGELNQEPSSCEGTVLTTAPCCPNWKPMMLHTYYCNWNIRWHISETFAYNSISRRVRTEHVPVIDYSGLCVFMNKRNKWTVNTTLPLFHCVISCQCPSDSVNIICREEMRWSGCIGLWLRFRTWALLYIETQKMGQLWVFGS